MNRILRRPMFRTGGSAEGITSGLSRQGYQGTGNPSDQRVLKDVLPEMTIGQMRDLSRDLSYRPQRNNLRDFMINFGLDIASRPPSGSIFSTAAAAAKGPFDRYTASKQEADAAQYATESDMFKTMISAQAEVLGAEKEGGDWLEQWKFEQIPALNKTIARLSAKKDKGDITADEKLELQNALDQKGRIVKISPVLQAFLGTKRGGYMVLDEMDTLLLEDQKLPKEERKYKGKKDTQLAIDAIANVESRLQMAEGGRVGYQSGNMVQPNAMQAAMPMDQGSEVPPEVQNIDYETLRARLPATITDDIVRLIANSAEAMEDFATIQTQQDINNFNEKYGVELVLPAEA